MIMAASPLTGRFARAAEEITYFTWAGYDYPALFGTYLEKHGSPPKFALYADATEALQKVRAGYVPDVIHPCYDNVKEWRESGYFQPIDTSRLSHWNELIPNLKSLNAANVNGEQWFVPMDWGQTSITYRTDLVDPEGGEESWGILWDKRHAGKIAMSDGVADAWFAAAVYAGVDVNNIREKDFAEVKAVLREQRPLVRFYGSDPTTIEQGLASGEIVAAVTWNDAAYRLRQDGAPVKFAQPKEGPLGWVCGPMLHKGASDVERAHDMIDAMISPESGKVVITEFSFGHSNAEAFAMVDETILADLGLSSKPFDILSNSHFVEPVSTPVAARMSQDFEEIKSGM